MTSRFPFASLLSNDTMPTSLPQNDRPTLELNDGFDATTPELRPYVAEVQRLLRNKGYQIPSDGLFSATVKAAVVDFQRKNGLKDDGIVGPKTWTALYINDRPLLRLYDGYDHVTPNLRDAVRELQALLKSKGFPIAKIDGRFGPTTEGFVKQFQAANGLTADGIVGAKTWAAFFKVVVESPFFKDDARITTVSLSPVAPIAVNQGWPASRVRLGELYNRLGGLMQRISDLTSISVEAALSVFYVESGGRQHRINKAIIRFENHHFYRYWGRFNEDVYNRYFQHGGHAGVGGNTWQNHRFRENQHDPFRSFHGNQDLEYRVLQLSAKLANDPEPGLLSISIGGPQILISAYRNIGYTTAQAMYDAFQAGESAHVLGFFDFCRNVKAPEAGALIRYLRDGDFDNFTRYYNGSGQVATYSKLITDALAEAKKLGIPH